MGAFRSRRHLILWEEAAGKEGRPGSCSPAKTAAPSLISGKPKQYCIPGYVNIQVVRLFEAGLLSIHHTDALCDAGITPRPSYFVAHVTYTALSLSGSLPS